MSSITWKLTRWWFQIFFIFTPIWGYDPIWLIFFKWVETTNQLRYEIHFSRRQLRDCCCCAAHCHLAAVWNCDCKIPAVGLCEFQRNSGNHPTTYPCWCLFPYEIITTDEDIFLNLLYSDVFCWWVFFCRQIAWWGEYLDDGSTIAISRLHYRSGLPSCAADGFPSCQWFFHGRTPWLR